MKIITYKRIWCKLIKIYYSSKKEVVGRNGEIIGESRDGNEWRVKWEGMKSSYNYPKSHIKITK